MTEDFKKNLLDYITGNLKKTTPTDDEFNIISNIDSSFNWNPYLNSIESSTIYINGILKSDLSEISVVYGGYVINNNLEKGFILFLDKNMDPFKLSTTYNTGTDLLPIHKLKIDEENNIYGIIGQYYNSGSQIYFAMFNNFLIQQNNEYVIDLRKSYSINETNYCCLDIFKSPNSSRYIFFGGNVRTFNHPRAIELKINVGSENEWLKWQPYNSNYRILIACNAEFDKNDNLRFKMFISTGNSIILSYFDGENLSNNSLLDLGNDYGNITPIFTVPSFSFDNINLGYIVFNTIQTINGNINRFHLKLYKYDNLGLHEIFDENFDFDYTTDFRNKYQLTIARDLDNSIILVLNKYTDSTNSVNIAISKLDYDTSEVTNFEKVGEYDFIPSSPNDGTILSSSVLLIRNYNLLNLLIFNGNIYVSNNGIFHCQKLKILSILNGYSGIDYIDENSFVPKSVKLYNSRDLIFARNLYNIDVQNNITISSVEIPNTYLNTETITHSTLVSETEMTLISQEKGINKNIYEDVHMNFINSISISNENDLKNKILNLDASSKLNNLINKNNSYNDAKITKARINYNESSAKIIPIIFKDTSDDMLKEVSFTIYVDKLFNSIDLLSNDEQINYQTINTSDLQVDKYYKIKQFVRIL